MTVPRDVYDFFIEPIRKEDQRIGHRFLQRYLRGVQSVWETLHDKIHAIPTIWSVDECPDSLLKYLKWIVGWTSALDSVTAGLSFDELRRLISISGRLWKERGTEDTIVDVMSFTTGQRCRTWNWFDFRWIVGETGAGEEHDGRDPWIIAAADVYESNLRIVDEGDLNRTLVVELLKIMRATGERWEITYLAFLDQFLVDGDDTQWEKNPTDNPSLAVADGKMALTDTSQLEWTWTNSEAVTWSTYMAYFRLRGTSNPSTGDGYGFMAYLTNVSNYYYVKCSPQFGAIWLYRVSGGVPTIVGNVAVVPFYDDVYYGYRIVLTTEGANLRIRVYIDGVEMISYLDATPLSAGTIGIYHDSGYTVEASEIEVMDLPGQSDYVDINS